MLVEKKPRFQTAKLLRWEHEALLNCCSGAQLIIAQANEVRGAQIAKRDFTDRDIIE